LTGLAWGQASFNMGVNTFPLNSFSSRGNGADVVRLDFNAGGFGVSVSAGNTGSDISTATQESIAMSYNFGDWTVAAGFASDVAIAATAVASTAGTTADMISASVHGNIGDFGVGLSYSDWDTVGSKVVLSGSYSFGDTGITGYIGSLSEDVSAATGVASSAGIGSAGEEMSYGIGFTHSLGGATLAGGVSDVHGTTRADLGVRFSF